MSGFRLDASLLEAGLNALIPKSDAALRMYAETAALKLQNYARDKAPWTDRTGHARQRLNASVSKIAHGYKIALAQGVDYGIFLELAHEKRFAIIQPTILANSNDIMKGFNRLLERLG